MPRLFVMCHFVKFSAVMLALVVFGQSVNAASHNFDFASGESDFERSLVFSSQPVSPLAVTVRAGRILKDGSIDIEKPVLRQNSGTGIGVCGRGVHPSTRLRRCNIRKEREQQQVNGGTRRDMVILDFGTDVLLENIAFDRIGTPFERCFSRGCTTSKQVVNSYQVYGLTATGWELVADRSPVSTLAVPTESLTHSVFGIVARRSWDVFRVSGVTVSTSDFFAPPSATLPAPLPIPPQPKPIPLPAASWLLVASLMVLSVFSRRTSNV